MYIDIIRIGHEWDKIRKNVYRIFMTNCHKNEVKIFKRGNSVGTNSKIPNFEHSNFGMSELRTPRTYGRKFKSNSNFKGRTSNFYKDK